MTAELILYAMIAGGLIFWLRSVLGTRHGDERQRPNPFASADLSPADTAQSSPDERAANENKPEDHKVTEENMRASLDQNMEINRDAEDGLMQISAKDHSFNILNFLRGAQDAFVMIVEAFARHDKDALRNLLAPQVFDAFESVINDREKNGYKAITEIHAIRKAEIVKAWADAKTAFVTVRFVSDESNALMDKNGQTIEGHPDRISETIDVWTFGRAFRAKSPVWFLHETRDEDAAQDDHKTVPDSE